MTGKRVIVISGWRLHEDKDFIHSQLNRVIWLRFNPNDLFFRVGDAKGADAFAREWLQAWFREKYKVYEADWDQFGLTAGPTRNREMLVGQHDQHGLAELLIAFPQPGVYRYKDSGTWGCAKEAFRLGVEVFIPRYRLEENDDS